MPKHFILNDPPRNTLQEQQDLAQQLQWNWSSGALEYLTLYPRLTDYVLSPSELEKGFLENWSHIPTELFQAQHELGGLTIPRYGRTATLGITSVSHPSDWHPQDQVDEDFYYARYNTQFVYAITHAGEITFNDKIIFKNAKDFVETLAQDRKAHY